MESMKIEHPKNIPLTAPQTLLYPYFEPTYPLTKTEEFSEDVFRQLVVDMNFATVDRNRLSTYGKHKRTGGSVLVKYQLAENVRELGLGRLYPQDCIGMQSFPNTMRNPMLADKYFDIDMENCHYNIAVKYCDRYDLPHIWLSKYIDDRNNILKSISDSRSKAKTELLKILYGGNIKCYNDTYEEQEGDIKMEGVGILTNIQTEVQNLMDAIWQNNTALQKAITANSKKKAKTTGYSNPKASLMAILFQTDERKMLMYIDHLLRIHNRQFDILIHDGGLVRKLEGETTFPPELLASISLAVVDKFRINTTLTQKPILHFWTPMVLSYSPYDIFKREFEQSSFIVGSKIITVSTSGELRYSTASEMGVQMRNRHFTGTNKKGEPIDKFFFEEWLKDPKRREYANIDFIPNIDECPAKTFNLFRGFKATRNPPILPLSKECIESIMTLIKYHLDMLTSGNSEWMLRYLASIIRNPMMKTEIAVLLRDISGFIQEGGGTGKNKFFEEFFGNRVLGEDLIYTIGSNTELYSEFNSQFEGKLMVIVEEACSKDNHSNNDILKSKITSKKQNVNKKCVPSYQVNDFTNYIFTSNNVNPLPIKSGSRRYAVFDALKKHRNDVQYFTNLHAMLIENEYSPYVFYTYLTTKVKPFDSPIDAQTSIPITDAYREMRMMNSPTYIKWIIHNLENGKLNDGSTADLYDEYTDWIKRWNETNDSHAISITAFGRLITSPCNEISIDCLQTNISDSMSNKVKNRGKSIIRWNLTPLVNALIESYLLPYNFEYVPYVYENQGCLIEI